MQTVLRLNVDARKCGGAVASPGMAASRPVVGGQVRERTVVPAMTGNLVLEPTADLVAANPPLLHASGGVHHRHACSVLRRARHLRVCGDAYPAGDGGLRAASASVRGRGSYGLARGVLRRGGDLRRQRYSREASIRVVVEGRHEWKAQATVEGTGSSATVDSPEGCLRLRGGPRPTAWTCRLNPCRLTMNPSAFCELVS
ncbi:hypothetical protein T492DRAFT_500179 [Pavlovales sp. CCMP2436]|nr:hypothetical protein T492DRAFT_500179 [Pavlovales sp. CCMP2436]